METRRKSGGLHGKLSLRSADRLLSMGIKLAQISVVQGHRAQLVVTTLNCAIITMLLCEYSNDHVDDQVRICCREKWGGTRQLSWIWSDTGLVETLLARCVLTGSLTGSALSAQQAEEVDWKLNDHVGPTPLYTLLKLALAAESRPRS